MELILHSNYLQIHEVLIIKSLNKENFQLVDSNINYYRNQCLIELVKYSGQELSTEFYNKLKKCDFCKKIETKRYDPFKNGLACEKCITITIGKTETIKKYKLKEDEIDCLDYLYFKHDVYKNYITLFSKKDVISLLFLKYGISNPELLKKTTNNARNKRIQQINTLSVENNFLTDEYILNGKGGIRRLKINLLKWDNFDDTLNNYPKLDKLKKKKYFEKYLNNDNYLEEKNQKIIRKENLERELKKNNLVLRNDSDICKKYIKFNEGNLEDVVNMMIEMNHLYTKTKYPKIYKKMLDEEYKEAKEIIRNSYGFIRNQDEYQELLNDLVDRVEISKRAKSIVSSFI
jgi:hypothetical protein